MAKDKKPTKSDLFVAQTSFAVPVEGQRNLVVQMGDVMRGDHPAVQFVYQNYKDGDDRSGWGVIIRPKADDDFVVQEYVVTPEGGRNVEMATAAPGERRAAKKPASDDG